MIFHASMDIAIHLKNRFIVIAIMGILVFIVKHQNRIVTLNKEKFYIYFALINF